MCMFAFLLLHVYSILHPLCREQQTWIWELEFLNCFTFYWKFMCCLWTPKWSCVIWTEKAALKIVLYLSILQWSLQLLQLYFTKFVIFIITVNSYWLWTWNRHSISSFFPLPTDNLSSTSMTSRSWGTFIVLRSLSLYCGDICVCRSSSPLLADSRGTFLALSCIPPSCQN